MRYLAASKLSLFLILIIAGNAFSQDNNSEISGRVIDQNGKPVALVFVELLNEVNSSIARIRTDEGGAYRFSRLSFGRFTVRVLPSGQNFKETTFEFELYSPFSGAFSSPHREYRDIVVRRNQNNRVNPAAVIFAQEVPNDAKELFEQAKKDLDNKRTAAAVSNLNKAIKIFPDYFDALENLGNLKNAQNDFPEAVDFFRRALKINPRAVISWYGIGYSYLKLKDNSSALIAAKQGLSFAPESSAINFLIGLVNRAEGKFTEAETYMLKADKLADGKNAEISWNLALLYGNDLKNYGKAADRLETYLKYAGKIPNKGQITKLIKRFRKLDSNA